MDSSKLFRQIKNFYSTPFSHSTCISYKDSSREGPNVLNGWANYFEDLGNPSPNSKFDHIHFTKICSVSDQLVALPPGDSFRFSVSDFNDTVASLKLEKAAGPDDIESEHILYNGPVVSRHLLDLFNALIFSCHIPTIFKLGYVTPIPKEMCLPLYLAHTKHMVF